MNRISCLGLREGVEASRRGIDLNIFRLGDYQIPYGYTPVLVATADTVRCKAVDRIAPRIVAYGG